MCVYASSIFLIAYLIVFNHIHEFIKIYNMILFKGMRRLLITSFVSAEYYMKRLNKYVHGENFALQINHRENRMSN